MTAKEPSTDIETAGHSNSSGLYAQVIQDVLEAAELMDVPQHLKLILSEPKTEVSVHFPTRMDDGDFRLFRGYRVQHNNILGPYKGGIRYHESVNLDDTKGLAALMTMKSALVRLPFGGTKGGVQVNPHQLSEDENMRVTRRFVSALGDNIGAEHDIPAPDVGTNERVMAWAVDTAMNLAPPRDRTNCLAVMTGKPLEFGGSAGREKATGQGLVFVMDELIPDLGMQMKGMKFSVLGFGNVGAWTARLLQERGATLVAVADHTGALVNHDGIDAEQLANFARENRGIAGYDSADSVSNDQFYSHSVDVLVAAALEQMIDERLARQIDCKLIVEGANAPTTKGADEILRARGIEILPAVLCNSGGVTVSYFEWKQNRQAESWDLARVDQLLKSQITDAAVRVREVHREHDRSGIAVRRADVQVIAVGDGVARVRETPAKHHVDAAEIADGVGYGRVLAKLHRLDRTRATVQERAVAVNEDDHRANLAIRTMRPARRITSRRSTRDFVSGVACKSREFERANPTCNACRPPSSTGSPRSSTTSPNSASASGERSSTA